MAPSPLSRVEFESGEVTEWFMVPLSKFIFSCPLGVSTLKPRFSSQYHPSHFVIRLKFSVAPLSHVR